MKFFKRAIRASVNTDKRSNQVVPHSTPILYDNDTLLAPNAHGGMTLYTIVDPTWELNIPGAPDGEKIKVTGTADKVVQYINMQFPDYVWPHVHDLNTTSREKAAQDDPKPNCKVFGLAPYPMANLCNEILNQIGTHYYNLGSGPGTCAQVQCRDDLNGHTAAIWWCNDVSAPPPPPYPKTSLYVWIGFTDPDTKNSCSTK